jgi:hypothetical protein
VEGEIAFSVTTNSFSAQIRYLSGLDPSASVFRGEGRAGELRQAGTAASARAEFSGRSA